MKKGEGFLLVSLAFILIFLLTSVSALTNVTSCRALSSAGETYELNQSISTTNTCINVTASNITLDCKGFNITFGAAGASTVYGVNVSASSSLTNITIRNCNIRDNHSSGSDNYGISFSSVTYSSVNNTTIQTNGSTGAWGFSLALSDYNNLTNSIINTRATGFAGGLGIRLSASTNNYFYNNNVTSQGIGSDSPLTLTASSSYNSFVYNNFSFPGIGNTNVIDLSSSSSGSNVFNNTYIYTNGTSSNHGISLSSSSNKFNSTTILVNCSQGSCRGISLSGSSNNFFKTNITSTSSSFGSLGIHDSGSNNIFQFTTISVLGFGSSGNSIGISSTGSAEIFNHTFISVNGSGSNYGIYMSSANYHTFFNTSISTNGSNGANYGINLERATNSIFTLGNINVTNSTSVQIVSSSILSYPTNNSFYDFLLYSTVNKLINLSTNPLAGLGIGPSFVNTSYNISGEFVYNSEKLYRKWYVDANISNQVSELLNNSNFSISNSSGVIFSENTTSGYSRGIITEYVNVGGTRTFLAQTLNVNVTNDNHRANSTSFNLSSTLNNIISLLLTDLTPPNFTNILFNPNSSNSLDPGINLSFNVSVNVKYGNASNVILQYYNGSSWFNASMQRVGETSIYNTTILLANIDTNYTFNILANDSWSNTNTSDNQTFNSSWDCGFNLMPSSLGSFGGFDEVSAIGNVTIQNYGDSNYSGGCSLDLRMSHSLSAGKIRFDGSSLATRDYYSILAGTNQTINLSALFEDEITDESFRITATDLASVSQNYNSNSTGNLVSSSGQPYLKITNEGQDSYNIYLTNNTLELKTYLQNIPADGTENTTAYNVTYNWSLPSGLLLESGTGNLSFVNVSNSSNFNNYINLTFNLTNLPSLEPRTLILNVSAIGYNYSGGIVLHSNNLTTISKQINITLSCYNDSDGIEVAACGSLDQDNPVVTNTITITTGSSSGGGGGGGGGGGSQFEKSSASYELVRGKQQEFNFEIKNKYSTAKKKMNISVKGLNSNYIDIYPKYIEYLAPLSSKNISVRINAPSYFSASNYTLEFTISGQLDNNASTAFIETSSVTLFIVELSREEVLKLLNETRAHLDEMNRSGFRTIEVAAYLAEAEKNLAQHDFSGVKTETEHANKIYFAAIKSKQLLEELRRDIENAEFNGISVVDAKRLLFTSETIFERGDYLTALARLEEAKSIYALETKGEYNLVYDIKNNPTKFLFIVLGFGLFSFGTGLTLRYHYYKNKLKMLDEEERLLLQLIGTIQKECFQNNKMSMEEYQSAMSQYEDKLSETIEERVSVQTKLDNMLKMKGKQKALVQEKERLTQLMKELQNNYLNKGKLETRVYEKMLKAYSTRLTKVDEQLVYLEAANYIGKVGKAKS